MGGEGEQRGGGGGGETIGLKGGGRKLLPRRFYSASLYHSDRSPSALKVNLAHTSCDNGPHPTLSPTHSSITRSIIIRCF